LLKVTSNCNALLFEVTSPALCSLFLAGVVLVFCLWQAIQRRLAVNRNVLHGSTKSWTTWRDISEWTRKQQENCHRLNMQPCWRSESSLYLVKCRFALTHSVWGVIYASSELFRLHMNTLTLALWWSIECEILRWQKFTCRTVWLTVSMQGNIVILFL